MSSSPELYPIPGLIGYLASVDGRIWSSRPRNGRGGLVAPREKIATKRISNAGHFRLEVCLMVDGRRVYRRVASLILTTFRGFRPTPDHQACHVDDDYRNNVLSNLYWGTAKDNAADKDRNGRVRRGDRSPHAKLSDAKFIELGSRPGDPKVLAQEYGVHWATVYRARRKKRR